MSYNSKKILKILIAGDSSVGKTSLMNIFTDNQFPENYQSSIGIDFKIKEITHDSNNYKLQIIDTAGQKRFHNITKNYFHEADGIFLVFDMADEYSFQSLDYWIKLIKDAIESPKIIILGNKCDLNESINITEEQIKEYKDKSGYQIFQVSAKDRTNIDQVFLLLIDLINNKPIPSNLSFYLKEKENKKQKKKKKFC